MNSYAQDKKPRFSADGKARHVLHLLEAGESDLDRIREAMNMADTVGRRRKVWFITGVLIANGLVGRDKNTKALWITGPGRKALAKMNAGQALENLNFANFTRREKGGVDSGGTFPQ